MSAPRRSLLLACCALAAVAPAAAQVLSCDDLRSSIEARIQARGVKTFSVLVVDANAPAAGQVVGTCEKGARKLVYAQGPGPAAAAPPQMPVQANAAASARKPVVITECADGRVLTEGTCKR